MRSYRRSALAFSLSVLICISSCGKTVTDPPHEPLRNLAPDSPSSSATDPGKDITGWNGVPWGATPDQAAKLLAAYGAKPDPKAAPTTLLIEGFEIQDIKYAVSLLFNETGLRRVVLLPKFAHDFPDFPLGKLKDGLQDKYGAPSQQESYIEVGFQHTVTNWIWQRPHGTVTLRYTAPFGSRTALIGLIYSKRTVLPEL